MSAQPVDTRMARLEGAYEQISKRLDGIEQRLDSGFTRFDTAFARLEQKVDRQFLWVIGLLVVSILLPLSGRVPH